MGVANQRLDLLDRLLLRPRAVSAALWYIQRSRGEKGHHSRLAVRSFELGPSRTTSWSFDQRILAGPLRRAVDYDGFYGLAMWYDFYCCIRSFSVCSGFR